MHMWAVSRPMAGLPTPVTHPWFMVSPPTMELRLVRWGRHRSGVSPLTSTPGSPTLQSRGQNQKWPTSGRNGYIILAV